MASFQSTVEVAADPVAAFGFLNDLSNLTKWDPSIRKAESISDSTTGMGAKSRVVVGFYGRPIETTYEIVKAERPSQIVIDVDGKVSGKIQLSIAATATGSTIGYRAEASMKGLARLLDKGLKLAFEGIGENVVASMRKVLV